MYKVWNAFCLVNTYFDALKVIVLICLQNWKTILNKQLPSKVERDKADCMLLLCHLNASSYKQEILGKCISDYVWHDNYEFFVFMWHI